MYTIFFYIQVKTVSSEDFDLRLMIHLLTTIASVNFGDLYPVKTDTRISAMLTKIKYIRNKLIQSIYQQHSDEHYNKFLDDLQEVRYSFILSGVVCWCNCFIYFMTSHRVVSIQYVLAKKEIQ